MVGIDQREIAERPVRAAHARKGFFNCCGRAFGMLGSLECHSCRDINGSGRTCRGRNGNAIWRERDGEIHWRSCNDLRWTERRHGEPALHFVRGGTVHRGAGEGGDVGESVVGHAHFDVGTCPDVEHGLARKGEAHFGNAEAERFAARYGELEPVVTLQRAARVEAQPGASLAVLCETLHGTDGRAKVSERGGVDWIVRRAVDVERRGAAREHGLEVGARGCDWHAVEKLAVVARDGCDVERRLHATLDLEGGDAGDLEGVEAVVEA